MKITALDHPDGRKARVVVDGPRVTTHAVGGDMISTLCKNGRAAKLLGKYEVGLLIKRGFQVR